MEKSILYVSYGNVSVSILSFFRSKGLTILALVYDSTW